jgi:hypothetical protein
MLAIHSPPISKRRNGLPRRQFVVAFIVALLGATGASAQDGGPTLWLGGLTPGGLRVSATDSWGVFDFNVQNRTNVDRTARVVMFFNDRPDVRYARDVWVPARTTVTTWMLVGPANGKRGANSIEMQALLYDRTDGTDRLILPSGEERVRQRAVLYRAPEPATAILLDEEFPEAPVLDRLPQPDSPAEDAVTLARTFRLAAGLSDHVHRILPDALPATLEAYDPIDLIILASNRIAHDPAGVQALRQWVEQGGKLWVMLDMVDAERLAPVLGDALDFEVVDRVGLTSFQVQTLALSGWAPAPLQEEHERPVDFVRVLLPAREQAVHTVNGWPAWFVRKMGRGKILFTTIGARAWMRPRKRDEPRAPFLAFPNLPIPQDPPLPAIVTELQPPPDNAAFRLEELRPLLTEDIGYSVVSPVAVCLTLGGFLLIAVLIGVAFRKARRREFLGWLGPAAALGAAAVLATLGESSRRASPPTLAVAQFVNAVPGADEAAVHGLAALYRPDEGPVQAAVERGGAFDLDSAGGEGQGRTQMQTDLDSWHWENLTLPAGLRYAPFRYTVPTEHPIAAVAHFGPDGLEGKLTTGPFQELNDAVLSPPNGRNLSVRLSTDGAFRVGADDVLATDQFLSGAVWTDRQQRRQEVYRQLLKPPDAGRPDGPNVLMAWAKPIDMHFKPVPDARVVGNALLAVPLQLERPAAGQRVTILGPLIPYRRILGNGTSRLTPWGKTAADIHLRFQLPPSVLPLQVERARLDARIEAPARKVAIAGWADGRPVELKTMENPLDPVRIEIADERLLRLDEDGGLHLNLSVSEPAEGNAIGALSEDKWTIDYLEVEITGTVGPAGK